MPTNYYIVAESVRSALMFPMLLNLVLTGFLLAFSILIVFGKLMSKREKKDAVKFKKLHPKADKIIRIVSIIFFGLLFLYSAITYIPDFVSGEVIELRGIVGEVRSSKRSFFESVVMDNGKSYHIWDYDIYIEEGREYTIWFTPNSKVIVDARPTR